MNIPKLKNAIECIQQTVGNRTKKQQQEEIISLSTKGTKRTAVSSYHNEKYEEWYSDSNNITTHIMVNMTKSKSLFKTCTNTNSIIKIDRFKVIDEKKEQVDGEKKFLLSTKDAKSLLERAIDTNKNSIIR